MRIFHKPRLWALLGNLPGKEFPNRLIEFLKMEPV